MLTPVLHFSHGRAFRGHKSSQGWGKALIQSRAQLIYIYVPLYLALSYKVSLTQSQSLQHHLRVKVFQTLWGLSQAFCGALRRKFWGPTGVVSLCPVSEGSWLRSGAAKLI